MLRRPAGNILHLLSRQKSPMSQPIFEEDVCVVCLDAEPAVVLPCRHKCVCVACLIDIVSQEGRKHLRCPMCREEHTGTRDFAGGPESPQLGGLPHFSREDLDRLQALFAGLVRFGVWTLGFVMILISQLLPSEIRMYTTILIIIFVIGINYAVLIAGISEGIRGRLRETDIGIFIMANTICAGIIFFMHLGRR